MDLSGKQGVILGVANERSIAWAIAGAAAAAGARLAFNYQNERVGRDVTELARSLGAGEDARAPRPVCLPCDLSIDEEIDKFFQQVGEAFGGRLDFLVHSVAFARREELAGRFVDTSREGFRVALEVSVYSLGAALRRALPLMRAAGGGSALTLSYLGAERVIPNYNVMGVAKAALEASVRYLAADVGRDGVRVNGISAGPLRTTAARAISGIGQMFEAVEQKAPLRRNVTHAEVAQAAVYLLSEASSGITGEILHVDCGYNVIGL